MRIFFIPRKFIYRKKTLNYIGNLWYDLKRTDTSVLVDFDRMRIVDYFMLSALFAILYRTSITKDVMVKYKESNYRLSKIENNNYIFSDENKLINSFKMLASFDKDGLRLYIREFLRKINDNEFDIVYPYVLEVFLNVQQHTSSFECCLNCCYDCADQSLYIGITNIGETMKYVLSGKLGMSFSTENEGIEWAVKVGNTTKQKNDLGGVGLSVVYDGLNNTSGFLNIISGKGWWKGEGNILNTELDTTFPGTIVILRFNKLKMLEYSSYFYGMKDDLISLEKMMENK